MQKLSVSPMVSSWYDDVIKHPKPTPFFTGRAQELQQLTQLYNNSNSKTKPILITGLGGIGKTELTKKFLSIISCNKANILWITASDLEDRILEDTEPDTLNGKQYCPKDSGHNKDNNYEAIDVQSLVVFDGVTVMKPRLLNLIKALVQQQDQQCTVIITTAQQDLLHPIDVTLIELKEWSEVDVQAYINVSLRSEQPPEEIRQLNQYLGGYPLAVQQALCYILNERSTSLEGESYGISHFVKEFESEGVSLLKDKLSLESYKKTMLTTLDSGLDALKSKHSQPGVLALGILQVFGLFSFTEILDDVIWFFAQSALFNVGNPPTSQDLNKPLGMLKSYSFVERNGKFVRVHPLVQTVIRHHMRNTVPPPTGEFGKGIEDAVRTLEDELRSNVFRRIDVTQISENNVQYILDLWNGCSSNAYMVEKFLEFPDSLFHKLIELSLFDMAVNFASSQVNLFARIFGKYHVVTTKMRLNAVFVLLQYKNEYKEALNICNSVFNDINPIDASLFKEMEKILQLFVKKGMLKDATNLGKSMLSSILATNTEKLIEIFSLGTLISSLLKKDGQYANCIEYCNKLISYIEKNYVVDCILVLLKLRYQRAICLYQLKMLKDAEKQLKDIMTEKSALLGLNHVETLKTKYWLTLSIIEQEQNHEKKLTALKTLLTECNILGEHPLTCKIKGCIDDLVLLNEFVVVEKLENSQSRPVPGNATGN